MAKSGPTGEPWGKSTALSSGSTIPKKAMGTQSVTPPKSTKGAVTKRTDKPLGS